MRTSGPLGPGPQKAAVLGAAKAAPPRRACAPSAPEPQRARESPSLTATRSETGPTAQPKLAAPRVHRHAHCCFVTRVFSSPGTHSASVRRSVKCWLLSTVHDMQDPQSHTLQSEVHCFREGAGAVASACRGPPTRVLLLRPGGKSQKSTVEKKKRILSPSGPCPAHCLT